MNSLVSPYKVFEEDLNSFRIGTAILLGQELRNFFKDPANDYLWKISTHRQTVTYALRNTEYINLRHLAGLDLKASTIESNQHMNVAWAKTASIPVFKKSLLWFTHMLKQTGASNIEFGRVFVSRLAPNSTVDLHIDDGKYFSYYDRFHFTVTAAGENKFVIRNEPCVLEQDSLYWVNNHVPHWLANEGDEGRINFIIDARLS